MGNPVLHPSVIHPPFSSPTSLGQGSFPTLPAWGWQSLCPGNSPQGIMKAAQLCAGGANPDVSIYFPRVKESRKSHPCPLSPWATCHHCGDGDFSTIPNPWLSHLLPEEFTA